MIVQPMKDGSGDIVANTSFSSPHFEEGRVRMLGIPSNGELEIATWEEHWNPYETLRDVVFGGKTGVKIMVDEEMRDYIVRGLRAAGFKTVGLQGAVKAVREIKSPAEIEILRAVNTGTVASIRAMRPCLLPGLSENQVVHILNKAMESIRFTPFFDIVLFDENAALPHGGFKSDKLLTEHTMVLIDVGSHYLDYASDVTRSFFIDPPSLLGRIMSRVLSTSYSRLSPAALSEIVLKRKIWDLVLDAQRASAEQFRPNQTAASVDLAARGVIDDAGYGQYFTHRVGHGIGIKAHESPYLNKGNHGTMLKAGMTFTSEPGVYLTGKFGVRHEDIFLVTEDGEPDCLSGSTAIDPWQP
jgi:Xaa-Pro aminopeptidase